VQWRFARQWQALKRHANSAGVRIVGDVPIFVAHDSADVWTHRELFKLDERGRPAVVAGVPPDYFSATGQLWGNPLYDWDRLAVRGYDWWIRRLKQATELFDLVRLDHFRGFVAHWEIPADAQTAAAGRWMPGPAATLFAAATAALGPLPLIAEDLGVITPAVVALREEFGYPGMRILQFAFGEDPEAPNYRPNNYVPETVVYTGTHDNDTTVGWFRSEAGAGTTRTASQIAREKAHALAYVNSSGAEIHWDLIRLAVASVARLAVYPLQDVLGLGTEARMNMPSTTSGNWRWRLAPGQFMPAHEQRLAALAETFDRQLFLPVK
jgi:4-alpha-glucanotransferase